MLLILELVLNKEETMKYPIVFYTTDILPIPLMIPNKGAASGLVSINERFVLKKFGINGINSGKYKWGIFDSSGVEYMVTHVENTGLYFNIWDIISFSPSFYVKLKFERKMQYNNDDFKEKILNMLKKNARKWKSDGHDSQTDSYIIKKIIRANSPKEIIQILVN